MMKPCKNIKGVSLVELLITLAVFSVVVTLIYSVYNNFIKIAVTERKATKTELDVLNSVWPIFKEIQSSGFGAPNETASACFPPVAFASGVLTIHSTAAGDGRNAGRWSYVASDCSVSIPDNTRAVLVSPLDRRQISINNISAGKVSGCTAGSAQVNNVAYWFTDDTAAAVSHACYRTSYSLTAYTVASPIPNTCAPGSVRLAREVEVPPGTSAGAQPILDCVFPASLSFRFGCITTAGNIAWQTGTNCGSGRLAYIRMGMLLQSSTYRDILSPAAITIFEDLPLANRVTLNLSAAQRNYKWKTIDQVIGLRNIP